MSDDDIYVRLRGRYAQLAQGLIKVEDLDDEELARGQLRASDGSFRGRPPTVVPGEMVQAMRREWLGRAQAKLNAALMETGLGGMIKIAEDERVDPAVRLRAQDLIVQRTMGKVPDKIEIAAEDPVETLFRKILNDPRGLQEKDPVPHEFSPEEMEMLG